MNIADALKLPAKVKGLEVSGVTVVKVYDPKKHPGTVYKGKQMPDWESQSLKIKDPTGETYANFKNKVSMKEGDFINLTGVEINEWEGKKSLNCKDFTFSIQENKQSEPSESAKFRAETASGDVKTTIMGKDTPTDWLAKERRELRKTIWDSCFMTIYPIYSKVINTEVSAENLIKTVNEYAEAGFNFVYKTPMTDEEIKKDEMEEKSDIPF